MSERWSVLRERNLVGAVDHHLAIALGRLFGEERREVLEAVALASRSVEEGHTHLDLSAWLGDTETAADLSWPRSEPWLDALASSPLVAVDSAGDDVAAPLVLAPSGKLYLTRLWRAERRVAERLHERAAATEAVDTAWLRAALDRLAPETGVLDRQRLAAAVALLRRLAVITGGPGTGKTWTVAKVLALWVEHALAQGRRPPQVRLLAPTGKAAARLGEAVRAAADELGLPDAVRACIPTEAETLHRALGMGADGRFRNRTDWTCDAAVVDEASMVDLELLRRLLDTLPPRARLVLLGDRNQLASVAAGTILADIGRHDTDATYSSEFAGVLRTVVAGVTVQKGDVPTIADCSVALTENRRSRDSPKLVELAEAILHGDESSTLRLLRDGDDERVRLARPEDTGWVAAACAQFERIVAHASPEDQLAELGRFRILCAHRRGPASVESANAAVERELARRGWSGASTSLYGGRPILVERNDYALGLFNGDLGVIRALEDGRREAVFAAAAGWRGIAPARLPAHTTVFAMTVHKSQGSELDDVALVLPEVTSPVLSRELLYTAVTRARRGVTVYGRDEVWADGVRRRIRRGSGLRPLLWN